MKLFNSKSKSEKAYDALCQHCMVMLGPPKDAVKVGPQYELNNYLLNEKEAKACSFALQMISCLKNKEAYGCEEFVDQCRRNVSDKSLLSSTVLKYFPDINIDKILRAALNVPGMSDIPLSLF